MIDLIDRFRPIFGANNRNIFGCIVSVKTINSIKIRQIFYPQKVNFLQNIKYIIELSFAQLQKIIQHRKINF